MKQQGKKISVIIEIMTAILKWYAKEETVLKIISLLFPKKIIMKICMKIIASDKWKKISQLMKHERL